MNLINIAIQEGDNTNWRSDLTDDELIRMIEIIQNILYPIWSKNEVEEIRKAIKDYNEYMGAE